MKKSKFPDPLNNPSTRSSNWYSDEFSKGINLYYQQLYGNWLAMCSFITYESSGTTPFVKKTLSGSNIQTHGQDVKTQHKSLSSQTLGRFGSDDPDDQDLFIH